MRKLIIMAIMAISSFAAMSKERDTMNTTDNKIVTESLTLTKEWDKTFPKSDKVGIFRIYSTNCLSMSYLFCNFANNP
ncbi:MAG: hypothetical protein K2O24_03400, partial [Muribaculaceae bacterium]|nr:hypothetical protein [Muribaculaceae bacterium]